MATKRSFAEFDTHPDRRHLIQDDSSAKRQKKKPKSSHNPADESVNWAKKRARTIERLFQKGKDGIPADVQIELERELAAHKKRIAQASEKKQRSKMIGKYHMVRFFERKKAVRLEKQLKRKLENTTDPEEIASIQADLHIAEVDKMYTMYFPFLERYISLYPVSDSSKTQDSDESGDKSSAAIHLHAERPPMWKTVEEAMESGTRALERLRDRKDGAESVSASKPRGNRRAEKPSRPQAPATERRPARREPFPVLAKKPGNDKEVLVAKNRRQRRELERAAAEARADADDDGGFFEES